MQSVRMFAKKSGKDETTEAKPAKSTKKAAAKTVKVETPKTHGVYLWSKLPRLGAKSGSVTTNLQMPKGQPQRIEEYDALNVQRLRVGMRHSAVISSEGQLYTFG